MTSQVIGQGGFGTVRMLPNGDVEKETTHRPSTSKLMLI